MATSGSATPYIPKEVSFPELIDHLSQELQQFQYVPQEMPLSYWPIPVTASFAYLAVVLVLWLWMRDRQPYVLRGASIVHNAIMCVGSVIMFTGMVVSFVGVLLRHNFNLEIIFCDTELKEVNKGPLYFWVYVFYLSKYYEWLDTILIVLKKNKLSFLHVYHHWITMLLVWVCLETRLPAQWSAQILNTFVHVFMYYYYLMSTLKYNVWWKRYITQLQIVQFILTNVLHLMSFYWHYNLDGHCPSFETWANQFGIFVINSYLLLFLHFYSTVYKQKGKTE